MIDKALEAIRKDLHGYLTLIPGLKVTSDTYVNLSNVAKPDGAIAIPQESLGLSLVNIEEERVLKSQKAFETGPDGRVSHLNPEIKLNLYLLISANFSIYSTALDFLSRAIGFFQGKQVFNHDNTPALPQSVEKLLVELYTLNFEQQNHLWGALGAKYIPSVMYRVRLIAIQEGKKTDEQEPITKMVFNARGIGS